MTPLLISNAILWTAVVVLSLVVLALARQIGVLHERVAPAGALTTRAGPAPGEEAPALDVTTLDGRALRVGGASPQGRRTLLFFLSPTCPVCKTVLPSVLRVAASEVPPVDVVLASDGERSEHVAYVEQNGLQALAYYVLSTELGLAYAIGQLPYAVLIDARGMVRAKGLVNSREHVESLFEADRLGVATIQDYIDARGAGRASEGRSAGGDAA
jgi:methylamine dehydrogenase accessory protein MauD